MGLLDIYNDYLKRMLFNQKVFQEDFLNFLINRVYVSI